MAYQDVVKRVKAIRFLCDNQASKRSSWRSPAAPKDIRDARRFVETTWGKLTAGEARQATRILSTREPV